MATYDPRIFLTPDLSAARKIILTPEGGVDTDTRWAQETPYLTDLIGETLALRPGQVVIDYGCGVGRLAKALIERFNCYVIGVDSSHTMRAQGLDYVSSAAFFTASRRALRALAGSGLRADAALAVWVLQHCARPLDDIGLLRSALAPGAPIFVVNNIYRAVPTTERPWVDDGLDIRGLLSETMTEHSAGKLDPEMVGAGLSQATFWGVYG